MKISDQVVRIQEEATSPAEHEKQKSHLEYYLRMKELGLVKPDTYNLEVNSRKATAYTIR